MTQVPVPATIDTTPGVPFAELLIGQSGVIRTSGVRGFRIDRSVASIDDSRKRTAGTTSTSCAINALRDDPMSAPYVPM